MEEENNDVVEENKKKNWAIQKFRGQRWCVTLDGWDKAEFNALKAYFETDAVRCAVIAQESGKNKCHPHWQIYFELEERVQNVRTVLKEILGHERAHIEAAKGTKAENVSYVYGVNKVYEGGFVRYTKNVEEPKLWQKARKNIVKFWDNFVPRPFQQEIIDMVQEEPDRRTIHWFWESKGQAGKTVLAEYLHIFHAAIITGGSSADMKHAISRWTEITNKEPRILIVDICRTDNFRKDGAKAIESIKNGLFFDGKYESAMAHAFVKPHVLCFANEAPDKNLLSEDRWKIFKIVDLKLVPQE